MTQKPIKIAIISDLHVMAPELLVNEGSAFEEYLAKDRKMLRESLEILDTLVNSILELKPDLVLVTGDLTKDGERLSHQLVAAQLQRLIDAGIQVLVVPGNHDINNPDAKVFDGDSATPADTITRAEFAEIYHNMGYDVIVRFRKSRKVIFRNLGFVAGCQCLVIGGICKNAPFIQNPGWPS